MKRCCTCKTIKPLSSFYTLHGGHVNRCKECHKTANMRYRRTNKDKINANNRAQYRKHKKRHILTQLKYARSLRQKARAGDKQLHLKLILKQIRLRAKRKGIPYNLSTTDLSIPDVCPVLGIKLVPSLGSAKWNSPSVDRIIPSLGYVKGNVIIVSLRANRLKSDASLEDMRKVFYFYKDLT